MKYVKTPAISYGMAMDAGLMINGIHSKVIKVKATPTFVFFIFIEKLALGLLEAKCHTIYELRCTHGVASNLDLNYQNL